jgi:hypothetical protein
MSSTTLFDPFLDHLLGQEFAAVVVESAEKQGPAVELGDLRAEAMEDAGELDRDVAAADDDDPFRQFLEKEGLVGGDHVLFARNVGHRGPAAGGQQDMLGGVGFVSHRDGVIVDQARARVEDVDPRSLQQAPVNAVEALDLGVLVLDQGAPGEVALTHAPAEAGGVLEVLGEVGGVDQQLLGHAAHVDAGAAEIALLGHRHPRAMGGGDAGSPHAPRARADNEEIVVSHGAYSEPGACLFIRPRH